MQTWLNSDGTKGISPHGRRRGQTTEGLSQITWHTVGRAAKSPGLSGPVFLVFLVNQGSLPPVRFHYSYWIAQS